MLCALMIKYFESELSKSPLSGRMRNQCVDRVKPKLKKFEPVDWKLIRFTLRSKSSILILFVLSSQVETREVMLILESTARTGDKNRVKKRRERVQNEKKTDE